jgi:hypothetical protein
VADSQPSAPARQGFDLLAVLSLMFAGMALLGFVGTGTSVLAVFAVGAGHVSLQRVVRTGARGRGLALAALVIGYSIAVWALLLLVGWVVTGTGG